MGDGMMGQRDDRVMGGWRMGRWDNGIVGCQDDKTVEDGLVGG